MSIIVPLIAALIAFIGVVITLVLQWRNNNKQLKSTHALKIAEMRQAWINDLRAAMSSFQSFAVTPNLEHGATREFYEHGTRIELMMNNNDQDFERLQNCLYRFLEAETIEEKYRANPEYILVCQGILKREWEVLKGELRAAVR